MWITLDLAGLIQLGVGAVFGAALAIAAQRFWTTKFALAAFEIVICVGVGVVATIGLRAPQIPVLVAIGVLSAAAPITLALAPRSHVRTASDAVKYLRRASATLTIHVLCGVGFAALGFIVALTAFLRADSI